MVLIKLDEKIMHLFLLLNILEPIQLKNRNTIKQISDELSIRTYYYNASTEVNNLEGTPNIFLNKSQSAQGVWQDYGQALKQLLYYNLLQDNSPLNFHELQNEEINDFTYRFCIPTFMLNQMHNLNEDEIMKSFNVDFHFAKKRITIYENKLIGVINYGQLPKI